jgi:hypothetical protein
MSGKGHLKVTRAGGGLYVNGSNFKTEVLWLKDLRLSRAEGPFQNIVSLNATQKERLLPNDFLEYSQDNMKDIKLGILNNELTLVRLRPDSVELGSGAGLLVRGNEKEIKTNFKKSEVVALVMHAELLEPLEEFVSKHNAKVNAQKEIQEFNTQLSQKGFEPEMTMKA